MPAPTDQPEIAIQSFDTSSLEQRDQLGASFAFTGANRKGDEIRRLFSSLNNEVLGALPQTEKEKIRAKAQACLSVFEKIMRFDPKQSDATSVRTRLMVELEQAHVQAYSCLAPAIALMAKLTLQKGVEPIFAEFKAVAEQRMRDLENKSAQAQEVLEAIRKASGDTAVEKQASVFLEESERHECASLKWLWTIAFLGFLMVGGAIASMFAHRWELLQPKDTPQAFQIAIGKILAFSILSSMLYLTGRSYLAHRHNSVLNKHRHNALRTYQALMWPVGQIGNRDIILVHASQCIFATQPNGYSRDELPDSAGLTGAIALASKAIQQAPTQHT